jgi:hypothetical protein
VDERVSNWVGITFEADNAVERLTFTREAATIDVLCVDGMFSSAGWSLTMIEARALRDWLNAHLPEHPAMPADAFDDMETAL